MRHQHFKAISSTQKYLVELNPSLNDEILISTNEQSLGTGQRERAWKTFKNSLAMSFTLTPNQVITLTSLELGVLLCDFFKKEFKQEIFLKWPNDLLNKEGQKLGGILISKSTGGPCIVGMGINLSKESMQELPQTEYPISGIFESFDLNLEEFSKRLYLFFLKNRLSSNEVITQWQKHCLHMSQKILFKDNEEENYYFFRGVGENGEALLEDASHKIIKKYSGSIRL